jgi:hypothetical protein
MFRLMFREKRVCRLTSRGRTSEYAGTRSTSSKVRPSWAILSSIKDMVLGIFAKVAKNSQTRQEILYLCTPRNELAPWPSTRKNPGTGFPQDGR